MAELNLGDKQRLFAQLVGKLLDFIYVSGYEATLGEAWRPESTAKYYASIGKGIKNSEHIIKLAIDISLFKEGAYLTHTEDYNQIGEWWKLQHELARWGGDFITNPDGNHFSLEHNGVK